MRKKEDSVHNKTPYVLLQHCRKKTSAPLIILGPKTVACETGFNIGYSHGRDKRMAKKEIEKLSDGGKSACPGI